MGRGGGKFKRLAQAAPPPPPPPPGQRGLGQSPATSALLKSQNLALFARITRFSLACQTIDIRVIIYGQTYYILLHVLRYCTAQQLIHNRLGTTRYPQWTTRCLYTPLYIYCRPFNNDYLCSMNVFFANYINGMRN